MFDENPQNPISTVPPVNPSVPPIPSSTPVNPAPVDDIFAATDSNIKDSPFTPAGGQVPPPVEMPMSQIAKVYFWHKWWFWVGLAVIIVIAGGVLWWQGSAPAGNTELTANNNQPINNPPQNQPPVNNPPPVLPPDQDSDGLTDAEEQTVGTDPLKPDTDSDGLFDREEVKVYLTDPLKADTDGDTFADGVEIQNGYNPKGDGKLLELPVQ